RSCSHKQTRSLRRTARPCPTEGDRSTTSVISQRCSPSGRCAGRRRVPCTRRPDPIMQLNLSINSEPVTRDVEPRQLLVHYIRDTPGLTGTHWGYDTSNCGACVVLMDGQPVKSCTILAAMAAGHEIRTVESLERDGQLDPVQ